MVIADEEVKHGIACLSSYELYNLISERQDTGVVNDDGVEWL